MIPKVLHLCWLSNDEFSPLIKKCVDSWAIKCPDYQIMVWNTTTFDMSSSIWVQQTFERKKYAFAADYIRLWALYNYGGVYLDSDVEVIKSFDKLLSLNSFMGFAANGNYEPAIIGAIPHQEWIGKCLNYYEQKYFIKENGSIDTLTLPEIIEPILLKEYGLEVEKLRDKTTMVIDDSLKLFPYDYFSPDAINMRLTKNTYTVHHFNGSWTTPTYKLKTKIFHWIVSHKLIYFIYTNSFQKVKYFVKNKLLKQKYFIHKYR